MAKQIKYQYSFKSFSGDDCEVKFYFEGWTGSITRLSPGARPFTIREYNSDNDFFKPIRPFQAEMEILSDLVTIEDFLANADDDILVEFNFNNAKFWTGWLIQDDFSENWIDTNHYITLRATDGLGEIGSQNLPVSRGRYSILDYLAYCIENTSLGSGFGVRTLVNNLFYEGMLDRNDGVYTPLTQVQVDAKTFLGDNKLTVLEKINKAWSTTVYQWNNRWFFARLEEWLTDLPLRGINIGILSNTSFTKTYEVNIGTQEDIKPVMPEMLKTIRRAYKNTKILFLYEFPEELVDNQNFLRGTLRIPTLNTYTIDDWTLYRLPLDRSVAGVAQFYRVEEYDVNGNVSDSYMQIEKNASIHYAASTPFNVNINDVIEVSFDVRLKTFNTTASISVAYIVFEAFDGTKYTLDDGGRWFDTNNYTSNIKVLQLSWSGTGTDISSNWQNYSVKSFPAPNSGYAYIYLLNSSNATNFDSNHKNLEIQITQNSFFKGFIGDYDQYTLPQNIIQNYDEQTYLDDVENIQLKGALIFNSAVTGDRWYRMDFDSERLTFKREKAIAHMTLNRRSRRLLQVNMLGNTWMDSGVKRPIWLQNKFIFTDDAPTKKWMIVNLSEMDFSTTEWKAQLIEVWDDDIDSNDPELYPPHTFGNIFEGE